MRRVLVLAGALVVAAATGWTAAPPPCPDVTFVTDRPLLDPSAPPDTITVDSAGLVRIAGQCDPLPARWRRRADGITILRARWLACGAAANVRLRMRYEATCGSATGRLAARRRRAVSFTAAPSGSTTTTTTLPAA